MNRINALMLLLSLELLTSFIDMDAANQIFQMIADLDIFVLNPARRNILRPTLQGQFPIEHHFFGNIIRLIIQHVIT